MRENVIGRSDCDRSRSGLDLRYWHRLTWIAAVIHSLVTMALSLTRFHTGKVSIIDIGLFDQGLWTTLEYGAPTVSAVFPDQLHNPLGLHFSAIVYALLPLYRVLPIPELLLGLHSVLIAGAGILIFWTCFKLLRNPRSAFLWTLVYLLNPFLVSAAVWDFHEKSFALLSVTVALYAVIDKRRTMFLWALLILLLCREHYGVAVAGFGGLWIRVHGYDRLGPVVAGVGVASAVLILFVLMPAMNPPGHDSTPLDYQGRYSWLSSPLPEATLAGARLLPAGLSYALLLVVSAGGAAFLSPAFLLPGIADLAANLLSSNPMPRSPFAYHSMALIPIFVIASARTSARLVSRGPVFLTLSLAASVFMTYLVLPLPAPGSANIWQIESIQLGRDAAVEEINQRIDPEMSVSAQANFGGYFSHRLLIYAFPDKLDEVQAVVLRLRFPYDSFSHTPFGNPYPRDSMPMVFEAMQKVVEGEHFGLVYWEDDWLLAIRGAESRIDREAPRRRLEALRVAYEKESHNF